MLQCQAEPTESTDSTSDTFSQDLLLDSLKPTEDNIPGPFHRPNAPYRAKIVPPLVDGTVLIISGRVWGYDIKKPLSNTVIDIWQADHAGHYDNDDPVRPPAKGSFKYRARLITDETGFYEYETIYPGHYPLSTNQWRAAHIHYKVQHKDYSPLITQLFFKGDRYNQGDAFIKESLIIDLTEKKIGSKSYKEGIFNIVLNK